MKAHRKHEDPLHDGSPGSYFARFVVCFVLGIFLEAILLVGVHWFLFDEVFETVLPWWPLWPVIPLVMGVVGVFRLDKMVAIYDSLHKKYSDCW